MTCFVLLFVLLPTFAFGGWLWVDKCNFSRDDALACIERHIDTDRDGRVSPTEVRMARRRYGGTTLKAVAWILSWFHIDLSTKKIMTDCGAGKDGYMTKEGWEKSSKTCLPSSWGLCQLKKVCDYADGQEKKRLEKLKM